MKATANRVSNERVDSPKRLSPLCAHEPEWHKPKND
jgi:hypothetical protein